MFLESLILKTDKNTKDFEESRLFYYSLLHSCLNVKIKLHLFKLCDNIVFFNSDCTNLIEKAIIDIYLKQQIEFYLNYNLNLAKYNTLKNIKVHSPIYKNLLKALGFFMMRFFHR